MFFHMLKTWFLVGLTENLKKINLGRSGIVSASWYKLLQKLIAWICHMRPNKSLHNCLDPVFFLMRHCGH